MPNADAVGAGLAVACVDGNEELDWNESVEAGGPNPPGPLFWRVAGAPKADDGVEACPLGCDPKVEG